MTRYSQNFQGLERFGCHLDFCISALGCSVDTKKWEVFQELVICCGQVFPFEQICYMSARAKHLFDDEIRLHGEGRAAIQFADGLKVYAHHGVALPEEYGSVHPCLWQAKWLLKERNAELRRVLIQGIGYARLCQELQAIKLDSWREYTLLKVSAEAVVESIVLLKMTCPSTHHIHALRVPPAMTSAREAICWVNHGIDSEAFAIET